ncbi:MAG: VIT domain-containing protein, partial [Pirellulales bacterium]
MGRPRRLGWWTCLFLAAAANLPAAETPVARSTGVPGSVAVKPDEAAKPAQGLGQLLVRDPQSGAVTRLNVARYHVNVVLQPPVALVQIDQSFYNPADRQEEGTFVFNLPKGASVSRFAMYVSPGQLVEGELIERQRASQVYQSIVHARRDPAILEQIGDNLFKMRVFPIFPRDTKRILLDFTLPLAEDHGAYRFQLPLLSDLKPIWDFRLAGSILGPTLADSVTSQSHPAATFHQQAGGEKVTFEFQEQNYQPPAEFSLRFVQTATDLRLRSYVAEPLPPVRRDGGNRISDDPFAEAERGDRVSDDAFAEPEPPRGDQSRQRMTYFMATVAPERKAPAAAPSPTDVLILADTSTDTGDIVAARRAVRTIVENLRPADRFRLVCVDAAARPIHEGWCSGGGADARQALARFDREFCLGASDLEVGIREAVAGFDASSKNRRMVIYVGAGRKTPSEDAAQAELDALAAELTGAKAALHAVVVRQSEKGRVWLESLARATGGLVFDAASGSEMDRGLSSWLLAGLPKPERIIACQVAGAAADDLFYPTAWLPDQPFTVLGRTTATDRVKLVLSVAGAKQPVRISRELPIDKKRDDVFIGRLWAQRKLDHLRGRDPYLVDPQWELA